MGISVAASNLFLMLVLIIGLPLVVITTLQISGGWTALNQFMGMPLPAEGGGGKRSNQC
jgi:Na+/proline symporter